MMRIRAIVLALLVLSSIGFAQTQPSSTEKVENPQYASWAKCKPGTSVTLKGTSSAMGQENDVVVKTTLLELDADKAVVESIATVSVNGQEMKQPAKKQTLDKMVTKGDPKSVDADALAKAAHEKVTVPAGTYDTQQAEVTKQQGPVQMKIRIWFNPEVPGGTVKMDGRGEADVQGQNVEIETHMQLESVEKK